MTTLANYQHPDQFGIWLGYQIIQTDKLTHTAEVELKIREDHLSPAKRVHGGVISSLFDFTCGVAVFSSLELNDFCSTVELKVNYLLPIELGDTLLARAQIVYRGNRLCVLQGALYKNGEAQPAAIATSTFNIVKGR